MSVPYSLRQNVTSMVRTLRAKYQASLYAFARVVGAILA
jgi:hypothetical protein